MLRGETVPAEDKVVSLFVADVKHAMTMSLGPTVFGFARRFEEDPASRELLEQLRAVRIKVYDIDGDPATVAAKLKELAAGLVADNWQSVLRVNDGSEQAHLLLDATDDAIHGIAFLAANTREAIIINLTGSLQPEAFADAIAALDVDVPLVKDGLLGF